MKFQGDEFGDGVAGVGEGASEAVGEPEGFSGAKWRGAGVGFGRAVGAGVGGEEVEIVDGDQEQRA